MVAEAHRLRHLEVRVAGHDHVQVLLRDLDQDADEPRQQAADLRGLVAQVEPLIQGHLVVPRAGRVELPPGVADPLGERGLYVHVDVLEGGVEDERPFIDLLLDPGQSLPDVDQLGVGQDPYPVQHARMRERAADILAVEARVEPYRGGYLLGRAG